MLAGPTFSPTTERIPREEVERETDQPTEVSSCHFSHSLPKTKLVVVIYTREYFCLFVRLSGIFLLLFFSNSAMPGETAQHTIHINGELVTLHLDSVIAASVFNFCLSGLSQTRVGVEL